MPPAISLTEHASGEAMAGAIADRAAACIRAALETRGEAVIAVSGGSTPKPVYEDLSSRPLDWSRVTVVLVDERWVEPDQAGSNERFVRDNLIRDKAACARLIGLKTPGDTPRDGLEAARARLAALSRPFDLVLLGLGPDGHTASWFPHAEGLNEALQPDGPRVTAIDARPSAVTGALTRRITLTRAAFNGAGAVWIFFAGADKREAWEAACRDGDIEDMPVRALLRDPDIHLEAHWAP